MGCGLGPSRDWTYTESWYLQITSDNLTMKYIRETVNGRLKAVLHGWKRLVGGIEDVFKPVLRHNGLQLEADRGGDVGCDVRMRAVSRPNCEDHLTTRLGAVSMCCSQRFIIALMTYSVPCSRLGHNCPGQDKR